MPVPVLILLLKVEVEPCLVSMMSLLSVVATVPKPAVSSTRWRGCSRGRPPRRGPSALIFALPLLSLFRTLNCFLLTILPGNPRTIPMDLRGYHFRLGASDPLPQRHLTILVDLPSAFPSGCQPYRVAGDGLCVFPGAAAKGQAHRESPPTAEPDIHPHLGPRRARVKMGARAGGTPPQHQSRAHSKPRPKHPANPAHRAREGHPWKHDCPSLGRSPEDMATGQALLSACVACASIALTLPACSAFPLHSRPAGDS